MHSPTSAPDYKEAYAGKCTLPAPSQEVGKVGLCLALLWLLIALLAEVIPEGIISTKSATNGQTIKTVELNVASMLRQFTHLYK